MTVVCYCNGVIASDSAITSDDICTAKVSKLRRLASGALFGYAGDSDVRAVIKLLDKIRDPDNIPTAKELADVHQEIDALIVFPRGGVAMVSIGHDKAQGWWGQASIENRGISAIGIGATFALGAMAAGKSAIEAVTITCQWVDGCRLPVHNLAIIPPTRRKKSDGK